MVQIYLPNFMCRKFNAKDGSVRHGTFMRKSRAPGNLGLRGEQWVPLSQEVAPHSQELGSVAHSHETQPFDLGLISLCNCRPIKLPCHLAYVIVPHKSTNEEIALYCKKSHRKTGNFLLVCLGKTLDLP